MFSLIVCQKTDPDVTTEQAACADSNQNVYEEIGLNSNMDNSEELDSDDSILDFSNLADFCANCHSKPSGVKLNSIAAHNARGRIEKNIELPAKLLLNKEQQQWTPINLQLTCFF